MKSFSVLIAALCIGFACALPNILGYLELRDNYEVFSHKFSSDAQFDEAAFYGPGASFFKETRSLPFETDIYEFRSKPNMRYLLPTMLVGTFGYWFNSLKVGWAVAHFIFPIVSFLIAFLLAKRLTRDPWAALFSAVLFCTVGFGPRTFLSLFNRDMGQPVLISRICSPAVTLPFLLITLFGLIKINEQKLKIGVLLTGIFGGLLFYTYYYYQLAIVVTFSLLAVIYLARKMMKQAFGLFLAGILTNIIAIPWYMQYYYSRRLSPDFMSAWPSILDKSFPRELAINLTVIIVLLIITYLTWQPRHESKKKKIGSFVESAYFPVVSLVLAAMILQFIIGVFVFPIIQAGHFVAHVIFPFTILVATSAILSRVAFISRKSRRAIFITICVFIIILFLKQASVWRNTKEYFCVSPSEREAENIIRDQTSSRDVVAIRDPYLNSVFATRLWRFKFYKGYHGSSSMSAKENIARFLFIQKIYNRSWGELEKELLSLSGTQTSIMTNKITVSYLLVARRALIAEEISEYRALYGKLNETFLKNKKLTYLLAVSALEEEQLLLGAKNLGVGLRLVKKQDGVSLYRLGDY